MLSLIGLIPGVSVLAGACILILSLQIIAGRPTPSLPGVLGKREVQVIKLKQLMHKPLHYITQLEKLIKPRMPFMLSPALTRVTGIIVLCLALIMISPLPLSNILPAIALLQISLGLLETDGLAMLCGWVFSVVAILIGIYMIVLAFELTSWIFAA